MCLPARQVQRPPCAPRVAGPRVERGVAEREQLGGRAVAAQQGAQARDELVRVERLDEVVVRAGLEPLHALLHCIACREQEHRQREALGADPPGHREPVHRRHGHVEHQHVRHRALHPDERGASVARALHGETGGGQHALEHAADGRIVVDDERPCPPPRRFRGPPSPPCRERRSARSHAHYGWLPFTGYGPLHPASGVP